ncbi:polysaccharide deacetylase family protein [Paenibacillus terrigena]|uniref:polysaccharide deacetylase family protein n=1 Tax=Paenibacillus terrigena TaxID=369333 RepID=UPI0028D1C5D2|nr:polysaccharide deacetylase family protein [Paenibacillus terrigena]
MTPRSNFDLYRNETSLMRSKRTRFIILVSTFLIVLATTIFLISLSKKSFSPEEMIEPQNRVPVDTSKKDDREVEIQGKVVYLTFDDGPSKFTAEFLDLLKEYDIKATFFMQGSQLQRTQFQSDVRRAVREGHYVGAHSMTHQYKKLYQEKQFVPEMHETLSLIHDITGEKPQLVRPPYGSVPGLAGKQIRDQIAEAGIKVWDWTIDSNDWRLKDQPNEIVENIKRGTKSNLEVVLMHEKPQTLEALRDIINFYKQEGYKFAVYDESEHVQMNFLKDDRL